MPIIYFDHDLVSSGHLSARAEVVASGLESETDAQFRRRLKLTK